MGSFKAVHNLSLSNKHVYQIEYLVVGNVDGDVDSQSRITCRTGVCVVIMEEMRDELTLRSRGHGWNYICQHYTVIHIHVLGLSVTVLGLSVTVLGLSVTVLGLSVTVLGLSVTVLGLSVTVLGLSVTVLCLS